MGEKIKNLGEIQIGKSRFDVEINHPSGRNIEREVHIQNDKFRLSLPETEFLQMAACILLAKEQLELVKGIKK